MKVSFGLAILVSALSAPYPVLADAAPIMHGIKGKCTVSRLRDEPVRCTSQLLIMTLPDAGRTVMMMTLARSNGSTVTIAFSGGKDEQPTLQDYRLHIDKVRLDIDGKAVAYDATGLCEENLNDSGSYSNATRCEARTSDGGVYTIVVGPGPVD